MSKGSFSSVTKALDPPLVIVTTIGAGERAGCVVGFHSQSSIDPKQYAVWLSKANHTYRVALRAEHLAVHLLTSSDLELAEHFGTVSGEDTDKFAGLEFTEDEYGVPLLAACPNRILLDRIAMLDVGGDHVCLPSRVRDASGDGDFTPLRLSDAEHLSPGHEAEERAVDPQA